MNNENRGCETEPKHKSSLMRRHIVRHYLELLLRNDLARAASSRAVGFKDRPCVNYDLAGVEKLHAMVILEEQEKLSNCA
ncbi:MAG TPA: hypothetical protein PKD05_20295 [Candidatus Melainabacteria bacterium]|nr:hypothetical protein [Candidatus Melainabacteria bacterium]HMP53901.1 hypothetical protein [Candidatus Melainabacteria bacterium]